MALPHKIVKVGKLNPKVVSHLNHRLYKQAVCILNTNCFISHIGWAGVGAFIDWLEENYHITKKE